MFLLSELFGATLGALIFGSLVYKGMSFITKKIITNPRTCYLISITLAILTLSAVSAWGNSNGGQLRWTSSLMYLPGLAVVAFAFYHRDVKGLAKAKSS
jgi:hypothetical protein